MELSREEFRENIRLRYSLMPQDISATCDVCGKKFCIEQALSCPNSGIIMARNYYAAKDWGDLGSQDLTPSAISYELKINSRTVKWERSGAGAQREGGTSYGVTNIDRESQGGGGDRRIGDKGDDLVRYPGQLTVTIVSRTDVSANGFCK